MKFDLVRESAYFTRMVREVGGNLVITIPIDHANNLDIRETDFLTVGVSEINKEHRKTGIIKGRYDKKTKSIKEGVLKLNTSALGVRFHFTDLTESNMDKLVKYIIENLPDKVKKEGNIHTRLNNDIYSQLKTNKERKIDTINLKKELE